MSRLHGDAAPDRLADSQLVIDLGATRVQLDGSHKLLAGDCMVLDRRVNDLVDLLVGGAVVARGELMWRDECVGVRIVEVLRADDAAKQ